MALSLDFDSPNLREEILACTFSALRLDPAWCEHRLRPFAGRVHLAVMTGAYLGHIFEGKKTIESRFSNTQRPPYQRVQSGDVIFFKISGGPIVGISAVSDAWFYRLDTLSWSIIRREFVKDICAEPSFWTRHESSVYASLMRLQDARPIPPILVSKRDRRPWVILGDEEDPFSENLESSDSRDRQN